MNFHFINRRRSKPDSNSEESDSDSLSAGSGSTSSGSRRYRTFSLILPFLATQWTERAFTFQFVLSALQIKIN